MNSRLTIGIAGSGQIADRHVALYHGMPEVEVVACAASSESTARAFAERHGIREAYVGYQALIERSSVDLIDVCLHNRLHAPAALLALDRGRHVYCEKPLAATYAEALQMVDVARARGCQLHVQLDSLFTPETRAARAMIESGCLGRVYHARSVGHRRRGRPFVDGYGCKEFVSKASAAGGALLDTGVYQLSTLLYLLDTPNPLSALGEIYQEVPMDEARRQQSGFDVEELAVGFVRFEGGLTLDVTESWAAHIDSLGSSCLLGSDGGLRFDPFRYFFNRADIDFDAIPDLGGTQFRRRLLDNEGSAASDSQHHMVAALAGRVRPMPSAEVALSAMLVSEMLYRSAELGREVLVSELAMS